MGRKENCISLMYKSNRSRILKAAIESNFLEQLQANDSYAFKNFLSCIYKGNFKSKKVKVNKLCNLRDFWKENKELLTKEINELEKSVKNPKNLQKTLGVEEAGVKNLKKCDYSSSKQNGDCKHDKQAVQLEEINPMLVNSNKVNAYNCLYLVIVLIKVLKVFRFI